MSWVSLQSGLVNANPDFGHERTAQAYDFIPKLSTA